MKPPTYHPSHCMRILRVREHPMKPGWEIISSLFVFCQLASLLFIPGEVTISVVNIFEFFHCLTMQHPYKRDKRNVPLVLHDLTNCLSYNYCITAHILSLRFVICERVWESKGFCHGFGVRVFHNRQDRMSCRVEIFGWAVRVTPTEMKNESQSCSRLTQEKRH